MNAPAELAYDLSDLKSWRGLRPGMSRKEVEAVLNAEGVDTSSSASYASPLPACRWAT